MSFGIGIALGVLASSFNILGLSAIIRLVSSPNPTGQRLVHTAFSVVLLTVKLTVFAVAARYCLAHGKGCLNGFSSAVVLCYSLLWVYGWFDAKKKATASEEA